MNEIIISIESGYYLRSNIFLRHIWIRYNFNHLIKINANIPLPKILSYYYNAIKIEQQ